MSAELDGIRERVAADRERWGPPPNAFTASQPQLDRAVLLDALQERDEEIERLKAEVQYWTDAAADCAEERHRLRDQLGEARSIMAEAAFGWGASRDRCRAFLSQTEEGNT